MKKIIIAFILLLGFFVAYYLLNRSLSNNVSSSLEANIQQESESNIFRSSDILNLELNVPTEMKISEKYGSVEISSGTEIINIGRNSTNYDNLEDYIGFSKNNLKDSTNNFARESVNGYESINGVLGEEKIYFIYADNKVFILSTSSSELYDDLDQIAQSFKYLGD